MSTCDNCECPELTEEEERIWCLEQSIEEDVEIYLNLKIMDKLCEHYPGLINYVESLNL